MRKWRSIPIVISLLCLYTWSTYFNVGPGPKQQEYGNLGPATDLHKDDLFQKPWTWAHFTCEKVMYKTFNSLLGDHTVPYVDYNYKSIHIFLLRTVFYCNRLTFVIRSVVLLYVLILIIDFSKCCRDLMKGLCIYYCYKHTSELTNTLFVPCTSTQKLNYYYIL